MHPPVSVPSEPPSDIPLRILIVDDHAIVRQGLRMFIELQPDLVVVGEGADGQQAVDLAAQLQPDVILLDLAMPIMDGITAIPRIRQCSPHARLLILTSFSDDDQIFPAIRAGAHGYLLKDIHPQDLIQAIRATGQGKAQLHPQVAHRLMSAVSASPPPQVARPGPASPELDSLTERERQVLRLIAQGLNNRQIASRMVISESTVKSHVSSLLDKLGLADRTRAAIWALKHDLGEPADPSAQPE